MDMGKKPLGNEVRAPKTDETVPVASEAPVQPMAVKEKKHYQSRRFVLWRTVVILLLIFATTLVVASWIYTQDLYSQLNKKEAEIAELQSSDADAAGDSQLAGNDLLPQTAISAVVQDYLEANKTYSGSDATFNHEIKYMDATFARVDILEVDIVDKTKQTVVATFFLKNVATEEEIAADDANRWVLIWSEDTLTAANKEYLKNTFSVTDDAFTAIREE